MLMEAYGGLGQLYHAYELTSAAEASYRNANRLAPEEHRWLQLLGDLYDQTGRLEEAEASFAAPRRAGRTW